LHVTHLDVCIGKEMNMKTAGRVVVGALALGLFATIAVNRTIALPTDDEQTVAGLDTQYQAAVKVNDATTMGRILADDFVLVTGSGKTYTRADLLAESRSGRAGLRTSGGHRPDGSPVGQHRGCDGQAVGERHRQRKTI
jgi:hypothetical protein